MTGRAVSRSATRRRRQRQVSESGASPVIRTGWQIDWQDVQNHMPPLTPLSTDQIEAIHNASLRLLDAYGIEVMSGHARALFKAAGADVDDSTMIVRADRGLIMDAISTAPDRFRLTPTNPHRALTIGGNHIHFGMVSGAPNAHDIRGGRRTGNFADYQKLIKLGQSFNVLHFFGNQTLAPNDLPVNTRHLDATFANLTLTDKIFMSMSIGPGRVRDAVALTAIARGMTVSEMADDPSSITNININSPRKFDIEMADAAIAMAEMGQAVVVTPFTLMGAMTPVTLEAALVQQNAEALFGVALTQLVRPGTPVVYGGFTSNVDMRTGAPAFGTPENTRANIAGGQLARFYRLPYRTSACSASNAADAQAVWETQMAMWGAVTGHGNLIYHAAGWSEGGLVADFEKLVLDCEMLQAMSETLRPVHFEDSDFGFAAHDEVSPGGHFFGTAHTMERYETAFYSPFLSDWSNNENWRDAGARTATERAMTLWPQILDAYTPPPMDAGRVEAMQAFIARRKEQIGSDSP